MTSTTIDGVLTIHEGPRRLRWAHELEGAPPPRRVDQWLVGGLWPDGKTRSQLQRWLHQGHPMLVVLDHELPHVELPTEHVPRIPAGVTVEHELAVGFVTLHVPILDWLGTADRQRGLAFRRHALATLDSTPRFQLPPLLLESRPIPPNEPLRFAHTTGACPLTNSMLRDTVHHLFGRYTSGAASTARLSLVATGG